VDEVMRRELGRGTPEERFFDVARFMAMASCRPLSDGWHAVVLDRESASYDVVVFREDGARASMIAIDKDVPPRDAAESLARFAHEVRQEYEAGSSDDS
jgi:hypothetical protein